MKKILLTEKLLETHFGLFGEKTIDNFIEKRLKNSPYNFKKDIDYVKVGKGNTIVKKYLKNNTIISNNFYLISYTCYSLCLFQVNTGQSRIAHLYMVKMNHIAIRLIASICIPTEGISNGRISVENAMDRKIAPRVENYSFNTKIVNPMKKSKSYIGNIMGLSIKWNIHIIREITLKSIISNMMVIIVIIT